MGTLTVEQVYQDRDVFAKNVREVASPDVCMIISILAMQNLTNLITGKMGIEILSFTIKDVYDKVEYLESLGKAQTSSVKRDADIGVAQVSLRKLYKSGEQINRLR